METLIPDAPFEVMPMPMLLLIALGAIWVLIRGADVLVDGAAGLAYRLGMPKVIVGATIVSLGTTSPECAVSVMAAWSGNAGLALGNAVGSIIADTGFIFGLGCVLCVLPADKFVLKRQGAVQISACLLLAALCYGAWIVQGDTATLDRWVGVLLLALLGVYMYVSMRWSKSHPHGEPFVAAGENGSADDGGEVQTAFEVEHGKEEPKTVPVLGLMVFAGLVIVIVSSRFLVASATVMAHKMGVPEVVLAATLVAMGTSLPELTIGIASILKGHRELLVGNIIGADILNVLFVVGAAAAAKPLPVVDATPGVKMPEVFLYIHLPFMLLVIGLFLLFILASLKRGEFRRWYGYPLLAIYVAYVVVQFVATT